MEGTDVEGARHTRREGGPDLCRRTDPTEEGTEAESRFGAGEERAWEVSKDSERCRRKGKKGGEEGR